MRVLTDVSRRSFLAGASSLTLLPRLAFPAGVKDSLPVVARRVEKAFRAPGKAPNDLQDAPDGLWILDQVDPNKVFKVRYADGSARRVPVAVETWELGATQTLPLAGGPRIVSVTIDPDHRLPDRDRSNNTFKP